MAFAVAQHVSKQGKEDTINELPQEMEESESKGVSLIVCNLGRKLGDERT